MDTTISIKDLEKLRITKGQLFQDLTVTFDYALPQNTLDDIVEKFYDKFPFSLYDKYIVYRLFLSCTVWAYPKGNIMGFPFSPIKEIKEAWIKYGYDLAYDQYFDQIMENS